MTLLEEERLRQLRHAPPPTRRPVHEVVARAAALRRARRARRAGAGAALGATTLALLSVLVAPSHDPGPARFDVFAPPSAAAQQGCVMSLADPAQVPDTARYVVGDDLRVPALTSWSATRSPCNPFQPTVGVAASAVHRTGDGGVLAAITVWGPGIGPFAPGDGDEAGTLSDVQVRGGTGQLLQRVDGGLGIAWQDAGSNWVAQSAGLTAGELVAALDKLAMEGGAVARWPMSEVFTVTLQDRDQASRPAWSVSARYGYTDVAAGQEEGFRVLVDSHADASLDSSLPFGAERVTVKGADPTVIGTGVYLSTPETGMLMLTWDTPDGRRFSIDGALTLPEALEVARSLRPVGPDDPAIARTAAPGESPRGQD